MATSMCTNVLKSQSRSWCASWSRTFQKRYLLTTRCHCTEGSVSTEKATPGEFTADEKIVFEFFNNCDGVTLKKLISNCAPKLNNTSVEEVLQRGTLSNRFQSLKYLYSEVQGVRKRNVSLFADKIVELKEVEEKYLGIQHLHPQITLEDVKDVTSVVALDIFQNEIAWSRMSSDRTLVHLGHDIVMQKIGMADYNHLRYPERIARMVEDIPQSSVYLMAQPNANSEVAIAQQAFVSSLIILMLNMRSQLGVQGFHDQNHLNEMLSEHGNIPNLVHVMPVRAIHDFYEVLFINEVLSSAWSFAHWMKVRNSPLNGMTWTAEQEYKLTRGMGRSMMTKCVLMTDIFCRSQKKKADKFPRMYS